jgi:hypothetical protein
VKIQKKIIGRRFAKVEVTIFRPGDEQEFKETLKRIGQRQEDGSYRCGYSFEE